MNKKTIEVKLEADRDGELILDPIGLWTAACEALGLEDDSTGFGYDSYAFVARDKLTGKVISNIIIGQ